MSGILTCIRNAGKDIRTQRKLRIDHGSGGETPAGIQIDELSHDCSRAYINGNPVAGSTGIAFFNADDFTVKGYGREFRRNSAESLGDGQNVADLAARLIGQAAVQTLIIAGGQGEILFLYDGI